MIASIRKRSLQRTSLAFQCLVIEIKVILQVLKHFHLLFHILNKRHGDGDLNMQWGEKISSYRRVKRWNLTCTRFLMSWRLCSRICCFSVTTVPLGFAAWPSCKKISILRLKELYYNINASQTLILQEELFSTCAAVEAVCSSLCSSHRQRATMRAISMGFSKYLLCRCCLILRRLCW